MPSMTVHGTIRAADRTQTEVVRPTQKNPVQPSHPVRHPGPQPPTIRLVADPALETRDRLRRRSRPDVRLTRPRRTAPTDGITQEVERLLRHPTQTGLRLVHRQPKL